MTGDKKTNKYNIICLSNQLWSFPLWTNKKHVMTRLSQRGHNVLFVDPPINKGRLFARQLVQKKWSIHRLATKRYTDGDVSVITPLNNLVSRSKSAVSHVKLIKKAMEDVFDPNCKTILWVYHVEIEGIKHYIEELNYDLLVYDCVDNYSAFPKYDTKYKKDKINEQEKYLATTADIVFATAPGLVEKLKKINENTYFTPNVGDYEKFSKIKDLKDMVPDDLNTIPRPRIGFSGAVDEYKFDRELMRKIASDYPNYSFVIIGPMALKDRESSLKELGMADIQNIYFLGTRDYSLMPNYMAGFDVFIIPYQLNDYTVGGCFPIKFHEGLAAGIPTIVTNLPAYAPFSSVCYISKSSNEFSQNIRRALEENNDEKIKERQKVAKENNWEGKVDKLLMLINKEFLKQ